MSFFVFDLDGTLADNQHRQYLLPNFDAFEDACPDDKPILPVIKLLQILEDYTDCPVEIWSARGDRVRGKTEAWLANWGIDPRLLTHMRALYDSRPDEEVKAEWLALCSEKPTMIFDDRQKVVDMWRANGITCAQVAPWAYEDWIKPGNDPLLLILVGPTGAGKSSWVKRFLQQWEKEEPKSFDATCVVSSDSIRANLSGDYQSMARNRDVFKAVTDLIRVRMQCGLSTVYDATNLGAATRKALVALLPEGSNATYVVVDRPLDEKMATRGWRTKDLIRRFHDKFQDELPEIMAGDYQTNVNVIIASEGDDLYVRT